MSTNPHATVVGVFRDREMAEQALDALKDAGFDGNQLHYSGSSSGGGFFKSLFSGQSTTNDSFVNELADLGVPDEETRYYANEYQNGHSIIAVDAQGNEREALTIMQRYGGYNGYSPVSSGTSQSANYAQQGTSTPTPVYPPVQQPGGPPQTPPPPSQAVQGHPLQESQQAPHASQAPQPPDTLQALQAQLAATQRQIQDAQAQLQAARQREAQLQAARQHDAQVQETQKRLEDAQAQLQATLAELRATQAQNGESNQ
jgi:hypothetical protein